MLKKKRFEAKQKMEVQSRIYIGTVEESLVLFIEF